MTEKQNIVESENWKPGGPSEKLFIPPEILLEIKKKSVELSGDKKFSHSVLSDQLKKYIDECIVQINADLYAHFKGINNEGYENISLRTLSHAFKRKGLPSDGAVREIRELLCQFRFQEGWYQTLVRFNKREEDIVEETRDAKNRYKIDEAVKLGYVNPSVNNKDQYSNDLISNDCDALSKNLQDFYDHDNLEDGLERAEENFEHCFAHKLYVTLLLRFYLREQNKARLTDCIDRIIAAQAATRKATNDYLPGIVNESWCEFELNEASNHHRQALLYQNHLYAANTYLEKIPQASRSDRYDYLKGRTLLMEWWLHTYNKRTSGLLKKAIKHLEKNPEKRWWVELYECIVLKLLKYSEWEEKAETHLERLLDLQASKPLKASIKFHCVCMLVLLKEEVILRQFLKTVPPPISFSEFDTHSMHLIEIIHNQELGEAEKYLDILSDWENIWLKQGQ